MEEKHNAQSCRMKVGHLNVVMGHEFKENVKDNRIKFWYVDVLGNKDDTIPSSKTDLETNQLS